MEKRISEVLARHKVRLVKLEISKLFGNILLIVAAPHVQLRFVCDRGCNSCEVCKRNDGLHWKMICFQRLLGFAISLIFAILLTEF